MGILKQSGEPIAVVGSSCRFPGGANTPAKLWELLETPKDLSNTIPSSRFNIKAFYHVNGERSGCTNATNAYLLSEDYRAFDASFFNINPREAEAIDPQQRLLLETVYEGIEASGYTIEQLQGSSTAVYVGLMTADFNELMLKDVEKLPTYFATGSARSIVSNRLSYFYDWRGPSMTIDTACSSSLVAVHQAVQTLRAGTSKLAVAAGANLILSPDMMISESKLHMLSPSGYSRMWDSRADGYARGEGFAAIFMKKLSDAIADGDNIECIIRETGVNSDGRSQGITMPNAESQVALIRDTYQRAGLDWSKQSDRCQFFEAHGTGTPAGDPVEAEAIHSAFFGETAHSSPEPMYVGSIKTVIGHLEGCAGLAGLLKASLALQKSVIPSNLHFENLNTALEPFYKHVKVPVNAQPWPSIIGGGSRRASVNSFGFGGTNAHIILESADEFQTRASNGMNASEHNLLNVTPLTLTANSQRSLIDSVIAIRDLLDENEDIGLNQLAFSLRRRSEFPLRLAYSGLTRKELLSQLQQTVDSATTSPEVKIGRRAKKFEGRYKILGVFTGQGAQWPTMGRDLIRSSKKFAETLQNLEDSLADLEDGPTWSLTEELSAESSTSRLSEAAIAQPLCTAIQIALVDLAWHVGIDFDYVIGHSSGEIAAAYAAGILSATDAMRIAYYRGLHANLATGLNGSDGAMMAAGLSYEQAQEFCARPHFNNAIAVAASNAPSSVTLSGDAGAIKQAKEVLEKDGKFARLLKVDKAYHSYHMLPCGDAYIKSLRSCGITVKSPRESCTWISSVDALSFEGREDLSSLMDVYWRENMTSPVLFSQAVETLLNEQPDLDVGIEVGPHAALKGPITQLFKANSNIALPYSGLLDRNNNDIASFSKALGVVSELLGSSHLDLIAYARTFKGFDEFDFTSTIQLPPYPWNHDQLYWKEPRTSKNYRTRAQGKHPLLGYTCSDNIKHDLRWRNTLRLDELPWLRGHMVQKQIIFPAAAYLVMALEAAAITCQDCKPLRLELEDVELSNAILLDEEDPDGTEIMFSMRMHSTQNQKKHGEEILRADFAVYSCTNSATDTWERHAIGLVKTVLGDKSLSSRPKSDPVVGLTGVNIDTFYSALDNIGLNYSGDFRALSSVQRRMGSAAAEALEPQDQYPMLVHPALLDATFQTIFAAFCWPGDSLLDAPYVPTYIRKVVVDPALWSTAPRHDELVDVNAFLGEASHTKLSGNLEVCRKGSDDVAIHVQELTATNLQPAQASNDREIFTETIWDVDISSGGALLEADNRDDPEDLELVDFCERLSFYYFRNLREQVPLEEAQSFEWHHQRLFEFTEHLFPKIATGQHPTVKPEWANDTFGDLQVTARKFAGQIDVELISAVGKNLPAIVRGKIPALEVMTQEDMLNRIYSTGLGFVRSNLCLARLVKQISHRFAQSNILEMGAGTGGATAAVLDSLEGDFASYTFTDISAGFFEHAQERFSRFSHKMTFKTLDVENEPREQGYEEGTYDVVIASNVLHATRNLNNTLTNTRRLLKPGGYLLLLEITSDIIRVKLMMSGLPGWWLGGDDGRRHAPTINQEQWDSVLKASGFSGVDTIIHDFQDPSKHMTSAFISQATDENTHLLRQPMLAPWEATQESVLLVGGNSTLGSHLTNKLRQTLLDQRPDLPLVHVESLEELDIQVLSKTGLVICATELDTPIFRNLSPAKFQLIQSFFEEAKSVLWLIPEDDSYANMTIGLGRSLQHEMPQLRLQFVSISITDLQTENFQTDLLIEMALRLRLCSKTLDTRQMLWTNEPEVVLSGKQIWIPRIRSNCNLNDRLNATRRDVMREVNLDDIAIDLVHSKDSYELVSPSPMLITGNDSNDIRIKVLYSSLDAIKIDQTTSSFLSFGIVEQIGDTSTAFRKGDKVLAMSGNNSNVITVPNTSAAKWTYFDVDPVRVLSIFSQLVLAKCILSRVSDGRALDLNLLLVHEPTSQLRRVLGNLASELGLELAFTTSNNADSKEVTFIGHQPTVATTKKIEGIQPGFFVDLSGIFTELPFASKWLKTHCRFYSKGSILSRSGETSSIMGVAEVFHSAIARLSSLYYDDATTEPYLATTQVNEISGSSSFPLQSIVDWTNTSSALSVKVMPVNAARLFRSNATYFLVGCMGGLGMSLCRWMIGNGARHLAVCGRNPSNLDPRVVDELRAMGGNVKLFALDVADKKRLQAVYGEICNTMPPVAGVANAAMVLSDCMFKDMSIDDMNKVLRPKVQGTKNLDSIFARDTLDFFVMFSSTASVVGNRGQSNYGAANLFMTALAKDRRRRGLAASTIDIGMVLGVGYITRTGVFERQLAKYNFMTMSESDFHDIFAEAIVAGQSKSNAQPEIITGLHRSNPAQHLDQNPFWTVDPRFSHHVLDVVTTESEHATSVSVPVKQLLASVSNKDEMQQIIQNCFMNKMSRIVQMSRDAIDPAQSLVQLGVDSLMAVEVRTWFLNELDTDIPVLKILGGATVMDLVAIAASGVEIDPASRKTSVESVSAPISIEKPVSRPETLGVPQARTENPGIQGSPPTAELVSTVASTVVSSGTSEYGSETEQSSITSFTPHLKSHEQEDAKPNSTVLDPQFVEKASYAQNRIWFLQEYLSDPTTFNVTLSYAITGPLRCNDLETAFRKTAQRHESLRTAFQLDLETAQPMQMVLPESHLEVSKQAVDGEEDVKQLFKMVQEHNYDLQSGKTMKVLILSQNARKHYMIMGFHHIVLDGFSAQVFIKDLLSFYTSVSSLPPAPCYRSYSVAQRRAVEQGKLAESEKYWKSEFPDFPPTLPLLPITSVNSRKPLSRYDLQTHNRHLGPKLSSMIKDVCRTNGNTAFHFHLTVFQSLISLLGQTNDFCIGISDAGRSDVESLDVIGMFVNMLPIRFRPDSNQSFIDMLRTTSRKVQSTLTHSRMPFDVLLDVLSVRRTPYESPMFQVLLNYKMGSIKSAKLGDCNAEIQRMEDARTGLDITMDIEEFTDGDCLLSLKSQDYLYSAEALEIMTTAYIRLLETVIANPNVLFGQLSLSDQADIARTLELSHGPRLDLGWPETVVDRFAEMVERYPNELAAKDCDGNALTYVELQKRANIVAGNLSAIGVSKGSVVAVLCRSTVEVITALLGIHRIGAAYVPLDVQNPRERQAIIMDDCRPVVLLYDDGTFETASKLGTKHLNVSQLDRTKAVEPSSQASGDDIAYLIYTSGSTGKPKGTVIMHRNLVTQISSMQHDCDLGREVTLHQGSLGFDSSIDLIYAALTTGGTVKLVPSELRRDPVQLAQVMVAEGITYTQMTSSEYSQLLLYASEQLKHCKAWKSVFCGGEKFANHLIQSFKALDLPQLHLYNRYGPTEITVSSSLQKLLGDGVVHQDEVVPCGRPLTNYSVYILDENLKPVPSGYAGEICVGGGGVAHGYLNNESLSNEKFVQNPFALSDDVERGWDKLYRTGDRGRLTKDGAMVYLGRMEGSTQIKLRGYRMELDDIENTIITTSQGKIVAAAVCVKGEQADAYLAAFVVFNPNNQPMDSANFLLEFSSSLPLPKYMCPSVIVPVHGLPHNVSGKLDRRAIGSLPLPEQEPESMQANDLSDLELEMAHTWTTILPSGLVNSRLRNDSDFFDLGGNSLLLVRLQKQLHKSHDVDIPLADLFRSSSLAGMAKLIQRTPANGSNVSIDWEKETSVCDIKSVVQLGRKTKKDQLEVLLTGATGFLGRAILRSLVDDDKIARVHCVAIRQNSDSTRKLPVSSPKIIAYNGDLAAPHLGMSDQELQALADRVDVIIHNGADVSFLKTYITLRKPNYESTIELIKMALRYHIPFHFVSTGGIAHLTGLDVLEETSIKDYPPPTDGSEGYVSSKWASERLLERVATEYQLPVYIHRPSSITGEDTPAMDIMQNIINFSKILKALPVLEGWKGRFDFIPVETVADDIRRTVTLASSSASASSSPDLSHGERSFFTVVHHCSDKKLTQEEFKELLEIEVHRTNGQDQEIQRFELLPLQSWMERAIAAGLWDLVASTTLAMVHGRCRTVLPELRKGQRQCG